MTNSSESGKGLNQEIIGIILFAFALYAGVSLFSGINGANWGGIAGSYLSRAFTWGVGYSAYTLPFILLIVSLEFILRRIIRFSPIVPVSFAFFIVSSSALAGILIPRPNSGGVIGEAVGRLLSGYMGLTGSTIILIAAMLITILVATGISIIHVGIKTLPPTASAARSLFSRKGADDAVMPLEEEDYSKSVVIRPVEQEPPALKQTRVESTPTIVTTQTQNAATKKTKAKQAAEEEAERQSLEFGALKGTFQLPPLTLLDPTPVSSTKIDEKTLVENSRILERKLLDFGIEGRILEVRPGPVVTMYEFEPAPGVKVNKITNLADDLALAMKAMSIRIVAPIPGKSVVGIEIPNQNKEMILLREMLEGPAFSKSRSRLSLALGKDISGNPYVADLARMPHLLIAGATGTGKSVSVNAMILSILFKATPEDARFLMVDPKMLELSAYEGIPHLITPVITDPKKAAGALKSIVSEMGRRYRLMSETGAKNIDKYNQMIAEGVLEPRDGEDHKRLPFIIVIIDELADLMMTSGKDVEECLVRLSQMARAAGIHLMVATQRPSVDVVTGLIKTNFPARIAFQLPSKTDSRTILDTGGAETLLGQGDMLFLPPGTSKLQRIHGVYVTEKEIKKVTDFWKKQGSPQYDSEILVDADNDNADDEDAADDGFMERYREAVAMASELEIISTSYIQRRFRIGYNTAARIIEKMEKDGIVGPSQGSKPRDVIKHG